MRILGLDIGQKTIGLAISDPLGLTAQGLTTIRRKNKQSDIEELKKVCKEYEVETLVIGLPKNMNNSIGFAGEKIQEFAELIKEEIGLKIEFWDERLTTVAAHKTMNFLDINKNKKRDIVDTISAVYILETYVNKIKENL